MCGICGFDRILLITDMSLYYCFLCVVVLAPKPNNQLFTGDVSDMPLHGHGNGERA